MNEHDRKIIANPEVIKIVVQTAFNDFSRLPGISIIDIDNSAQHYYPILYSTVPSPLSTSQPFLIIPRFFQGELITTIVYQLIYLSHLY